MRGRVFSRSAVGRLAGLAALAIATIAAALQWRHDRVDTTASLSSPAMARDWLAEELARCQSIGPGADDPACEAAWAEGRRRFFVYRSTAPAPTADGRRSTVSIENR